MATFSVTVSAYNANAPYSSSDTVTLADTGANIAALSAVAFGNLAANGIDKINATDNVLSLSVAQYQALGVVTLAAGDVITLADTGANITTSRPRTWPPWPMPGSTGSTPPTTPEPHRGAVPGAGHRGADRQRHRHAGRHRTTLSTLTATQIAALGAAGVVERPPTASSRSPSRSTRRWAA
jgi:hypothetical protein